MEKLSPDTCGRESRESQDDFRFEGYDEDDINSQKYEYNDSMPIFQPWGLKEEEEKLENDTIFTSIKDMSIKVEGSPESSQSNEKKEHVHCSSYETEAVIGQTGESGNDWLGCLMKQKDDFQIKQESDSELSNGNSTEGRLSSGWKPMLLGEDDLEQYAFETLARVLPDIHDISILPVNTRENQLIILKGAIRYIRELESSLEDTENYVTEKSRTRLDTAACPLRGIGEDPEPKRPKNGFIRFSMKNRRQISLDHPGVDNREISRILGCKWKQLTQEEKKPYEQEFIVEMNKRRKMDPNWRYCGMRRRLLEDLVEPMPSRLRPRDQLRSKIEVSKLKRSYKKRQLLPQVFKWAQCDCCQKWRRLPSDTDMDLLPTQWYCSYNMDPKNNRCIDPDEPYPVPVPEVYPHAGTIYGGPPTTGTITSNGEMWNHGPLSSMKPTEAAFLLGSQAETVEYFSSFSRFRWQHEGQAHLAQSCVGIFGSLPGVDDEGIMHNPGVGLHFK